MPFSYTVSIDGNINNTIRKSLESLSDTIALKNKPPETLSLLEIRAQADKAHFQAVLADLGYYDAQVTVSINTHSTPVVIHYIIDTGQAFRFRSFAITGSNSNIILPTFTELGLVKGQIARADIIASADDKLLTALYNQGYPFALTDEPALVVDYLSHSIDVTYAVEPGTRMAFGDTIIRGLTSLKESFVRRRIPWKKGQIYNPKQIAALDKTLTNSGLFSIITISNEKSSANSNLLTMIITLKERLPHTIKAEIDYSTDTKLGTIFLWEHRNLEHNGDDLQATANISTVVQSAGIVYKKPDFYALNNTLREGLELIGEHTDSYDSRTITPSIGIEHKITDQLSIGMGGGYRIDDVTQLAVTKYYNFLDFPFYITDDRRNNLYDPTKGGNYNASITPFFSMQESGSSFIKSNISATHYIMLMDKPSLVLAGRAGIGSIMGSPVDNIPANLRFYAGGATSVRGYGYKTLSPEMDGIAIGGSSLLEFSAELRERINDKIGAVTFIDAGNSFASPLPSWAEKLLFGVGVGIRYYTVIAPIRFDVAIPLDKVPGQARYQLYFSLGQAF